MSIVNLNRRALIAGAATAALAAPALISASGRAHAAAPMLGVATPTFNRVKVGDFEVTMMLDAARTMDGPHPIFGEDQEAAAVSELLAANHLPSDKMVNGFTPVIVNTGSELVLFDTGLGGDNGSLTAQLASAGYSPEQVDIVVLTHMHPDHIGGLMTNGAPTYPNARYVTGQTEFDFWTHEDRLSGPTERVARLVQTNVKPLAEKMTFVGGHKEVVPGILGLDTPGHTPGHMSFHLSSAGKQLLIWGDIANHFVVSIQRPDWHVRYDMDKEKAAATRKTMFDLIIAEKIPVTGYHMPFPALGYLETAGESYRWVPAAYQFTL
jgi:glyoxylase-like metal-dependent hydrolase (beta-lactamase superfamily II)